MKKKREREKGGEREGIRAGREGDEVCIPTNNTLFLIAPLLLRAKMLGKTLLNRKESGK